MLAWDLFEWGPPKHRDLSESYTKEKEIGLFCPKLWKKKECF